jgi:hypothetical protein
VLIYDRLMAQQRAHIASVAVAVGIATTVALSFPASPSAAVQESHSLLAQEINLTASDVPSLGSASRMALLSRADVEQLDRCDGGPQVAPVAVDSSDLFSTDPPSAPHISSSVTVWASSALADDDVRATKSREEQRCQAAAFRHAFPGAKDSATRLSPPTPGGLGQRVTAVIPVDGKSTRHVSDTLEFARGAYVIELSSTSSPGPFPVTLERHLANVLVQRAVKLIP